MDEVGKKMRIDFKESVKKFKKELKGGRNRS